MKTGAKLLAYLVNDAESEAGAARGLRRKIKGENFVSKFWRDATAVVLNDQGGASGDNSDLDLNSTLIRRDCFDRVTSEIFKDSVESNRRNSCFRRVAIGDWSLDDNTLGRCFWIILQIFDDERDLGDNITTRVGFSDGSRFDREGLHVPGG